MMKGTIALVIRYILLIGGGGLAAAGIIAETGNGHFCFDTKAVAEAMTHGLMLMLGGGASVITGIGWRALAKAKGGVT